MPKILFKKLLLHSTSKSASTVFAATTASPISFKEIDLNFLHPWPSNWGEFILMKQHLPLLLSAKQSSLFFFGFIPQSESNIFVQDHLIL